MTKNLNDNGPFDKNNGFMAAIYLPNNGIMFLTQDHLGRYESYPNAGGEPVANRYKTRLGAIKAARRHLAKCVNQHDTPQRQQTVREKNMVGQETGHKISKSLFKAPRNSFPFDKEECVCFAIEVPCTDRPITEGKAVSLYDYHTCNGCAECDEVAKAVY